MAVVLPGAAIGILGGGQLGRMSAVAARRMGYRVHCLDPEPDSPAGQVCDLEITAGYDDLEAVRRLASGVSAVSFEFENVPRAAAEAAAEVSLVRPSPEVLHICQNREREKRFLAKQGIPCARFEVVTSGAELGAAMQRLGTPCVLKTADFGYDGHGQRLVKGDVQSAWEAFGAPRGVVEEWVGFEAELSVLVARGADGAVQVFPPVENIHRDHILDVSIAPGRFEEPVLAAASELAVVVAGALGVVGLLAVEMFLLPGGKLLVNELAPRPHNSGHFSIEACETSQFEQHVRAVCGLPLGSSALVQPAVMWNLLGHLWRDGEPDWQALLAHPSAKLHLYGKRTARPGRKMGHVTFPGDHAVTFDALAAVRLALRDEALREGR